MTDKEITLKLSVAKVNAILQALGNCPYAQVFQLIQEIQQQAAPQVQEQPTSDV